MIETERLLLRLLTPDDVDNLVELDSDPAILRYINGGKRTPRDLIEREILPRFQQRSRLPGYGYFAAIEKASGIFLGWIALHPEEDGNPTIAALGYRLRRLAWGKGYATEGAEALIRRGFTELGMERVMATTYEENTRSRRVMERLGMSLVRSYHSTSEELAVAGSFLFDPDEIWKGEDVEYALDRAEWERRSGARAEPG